MSENLPEPMTDPRALLAEIRATAESFERHAVAIYQMHATGGWQELGYATWAEFCEKELQRSRSAVYRLVQQGKEVVLSLPPGGKAQVSASRARVRTTTERAPSQREAIARQAARKRGEDPGPLPTEHGRIPADSARAKARAQAKVATSGDSSAIPGGPGPDRRQAAPAGAEEPTAVDRLMAPPSGDRIPCPRCEGKGTVQRPRVPSTPVVAGGKCQPRCSPNRIVAGTCMVCGTKAR